MSRFDTSSLLEHSTSKRQKVSRKPKSSLDTEEPIPNLVYVSFNITFASQLLTPCFNISGPQTIVTVKVNSEETCESETFRVHKNYMCHYSPYFDRAFNGSFAEAESQELTLDDTTPEVFGIFVNWLYTQTIINEGGELPSCRNLIDLWILADRVICPKLQNQTIIRLDQARLIRKRLPSSKFKCIYENTSDQSPLRAYVLDSCIYGKQTQIPEPSYYPHELLVDIINTSRAERIGLCGVASSYWAPSPEDLEYYFVSEDIAAKETQKRHEKESGAATEGVKPGLSKKADSESGDPDHTSAEFET